MMKPTEEQAKRIADWIDGRISYGDLADIDPQILEAAIVLDPALAPAFRPDFGAVEKRIHSASSKTRRGLGKPRFANRAVVWIALAAAGLAVAVVLPDGTKSPTEIPQVAPPQVPLQPTAQVEIPEPPRESPAPNPPTTLHQPEPAEPASVAASDPSATKRDADADALNEMVQALAQRGVPKSELDPTIREITPAGFRTDATVGLGTHIPADHNPDLLASLLKQRQMAKIRFDFSALNDTCSAAGPVWAEWLTHADLLVAQEVSCDVAIRLMDCGNHDGAGAILDDVRKRAARNTPSASRVLHLLAKASAANGDGEASTRWKNEAHRLDAMRSMALETTPKEER